MWFWKVYLRRLHLGCILTARSRPGWLSVRDTWQSNFSLPFVVITRGGAETIPLQYADRAKPKGLNSHATSSHPQGPLSKFISTCVAAAFCAVRGCGRAQGLSARVVRACT